MRKTNETGCVHLVGAGPGDPELLTVKALRCLQEADVVVYDRLVSREVLELIPAGVTRIFAGKAPGAHHMDQAAINDLLARLARAGYQVVRLKGGDPFVFGRGGEEALFLARRRIPFRVVPGITAAAACATYAGFPLTHRGLARHVHLVAGHCREDQPLALDWDRLADPEATLAVYMGLANAAELSRRLQAAGLPGDTPAAVVENGATTDQRCLRTTLAELPRTLRREEVRPPAMLFVGQVVRLARLLDWYLPAPVEAAGARHHG